MRYGAGQAALYRFAGRDVFITLDPNELGCCYAFTEDRKRFIGRLDSNKRISPMATVDQLREANAAVGRRRKLTFQATGTSPARTRTAVEELNRSRRERVAELRKTGTNATDHAPRIVPVQTGFEGASKIAHRAASAPKIDRKSRDLIDTARALTFGADDARQEEPEADRPTLDLLAGGFASQTESPEDEGDGKMDGTDAEPRRDILSLVSGYRHERQPDR